MDKSNCAFNKLLAMALSFALAFTMLGVVSNQAFAVSSSQKISLNRSICTIKKGSTVKLKATLGKGIKGKKIVWSSSSPKRVTVSSTGKVKAKSKGRATITAKVKGTKYKATCKVVVGTPVSGIKFAKKSISLKAGGKTTLKYTISPKKPTSKKVKFTTSNKKVATVTSKGVVKGIKKGTATITVKATDGSGKSAKCTVKVTSSGKNSNGQGLSALIGQDGIPQDLIDNLSEYVEVKPNGKIAVTIPEGENKGKTVTLNMPSMSDLTSGKFISDLVASITKQLS